MCCLGLYFTCSIPIRMRENKGTFDTLSDLKDPYVSFTQLNLLELIFSLPFSNGERNGVKMNHARSFN